ncbi:3855_t:CDS:2, partial [Funneliformis geosporum]
KMKETITKLEKELEEKRNQKPTPNFDTPFGEDLEVIKQLELTSLTELFGVAVDLTIQKQIEDAINYSQVVQARQTFLAKHLTPQPNTTITNLSPTSLPQLPSFESLFIAGDKSFLNILKNEDEMGVIPPTYALSKDNLPQNLSFLTQIKAVLKPGDLGRSKGVEFVIQERCYLRNTSDGRYEDIAVYLMDGKVQGFLSRISANEVVNVAKNGLFQPTVLLE